LKKQIYRDCRKAMTPALLLYTLENVAGSILTIYTAGVLGDFADAVLTLNFSYSISNIWKLLTSIIATLIIIPALGMAGEIRMFQNSLKHDALIYRRFLDKTFESAKKINEGELQYRLEQDPIDFRCVWIQLRVKCVTIICTLIYLLYQALQIHVLFTGIAFSLSLLQLLIPAALKKIQAKYDAQLRDYRSSIRSCETEITSQPHMIRLLGLSSALIKRLDQQFQNACWSLLLPNIRLKTTADGILSFLDTFFPLLILFIGTFLVSKGLITAGAVVAMAGYFPVFHKLIQHMDYVIRKTPILQNLLERMKFFYEDSEDLSGKIAGPMTSLEASDLSFRFDQMPVFENMNFHILSNSKTAVIGTNGSGKSTLLHIICGLLKNYDGNLVINGHELQDLSIASWRKQLAYVEQSPYLFEGTVKENIHLGNLNASDEALDRIMEQLHIRHLAERIVSSYNNELSGGEKQRISIARALLKNVDFLIFDEPDNHLDQEHIQWLYDWIADSNKTILYVTHNENPDTANILTLGGDSCLN